MFGGSIGGFVSNVVSSSVDALTDPLSAVTGVGTVASLNLAGLNPSEAIMDGLDEITGQNDIDAANQKLAEAQRIREELRERQKQTMIRQQASEAALSDARRRFSTLSMGVEGASFSARASASQTTQAAAGLQDRFANQQLADDIAWWEQSAQKSMGAAAAQQQTLQQGLGFVGQAASFATGMF